MTRKDLREARRIQLFEATTGSIAYNGFAKTTLNGVAKAGRLSPSLLRLFFRSMKEFLVETLRHMALVYEASWRETVQRATTPMGRLLATIEADFNPMISDREGAIVWYGPNGCNADLARRACRDFLARVFSKESSAATALSIAA
jgi:AcrR family transcriptional regulator